MEQRQRWQPVRDRAPVAVAVASTAGTAREAPARSRESMGPVPGVVPVVRALRVVRAVGDGVNSRLVRRLLRLEWLASPVMQAAVRVPRDVRVRPLPR